MTTVMQFDSHAGWYNPSKPRPSISSYYTPPYREPKPAALPIEKEDFFVLLERARKGDTAAQAELRLRGNKTSR